MSRNNPKKMVEYNVRNQHIRSVRCVIVTDGKNCIRESYISKEGPHYYVAKQARKLQNKVYILCAVA